MGIRVPAELSLTGFDDLDFAAHATPTLTTVHVPAAAMGRQVADCLVAAASGRAVPASVELEAPVMLRDTTARPPPIR
jgi:LacI family transcriptional regulator